MNTVTEVSAKWQGEELITLQDHESQAWIIVAIHTLRNGRAAGGVRMKKYNNLDEAVIDALNLSEAMTYKFAMCNMNWGGAKSVIYPTRYLEGPERHQLLLRFGDILKNLQGRYYAGPDVGTTSEDMDILYTTGKPYVFSRTVKAGGAGSSSIPTAFGVYAGIKTTCKFLFGTDELAGRTVFIQGLGSVGLYLQKLLLQENARICFTETNREIIDLMSAQDQEVQFIPPDNCYETECDIFAPCAHGAILNANTIPQLKCKGVVGAANNQLNEPEDADRLKQRGILYAPDYVVNLGGAMGITSIEAEGVTEEESIENVQRTISETLEEIFIAAKSADTNTVAAAMQIAKKRLGHVPA
ncbi:MAG: Glu/Leu/Phe/Val dehydrogenase dimerization domain-containing protein [Saprospiraceae bacterium]